MTTRRLAAGLLLLLLLPAVAVAQTSQPQLNDALWGPGAVGKSSVYLVDGFTTTAVGTHTEDVFSARYDNRERITNGTWVIIISAAYSIVQSSNGVWQWQVSLDGEAIPGCLWQVQTINSAAGPTGATTISHPNLQVVCRVEEPAFGTHQFIITRSAATGTPATIGTATTSVNILNNDPVILSMPSTFESITGLSAFEFTFLALIVFLGVFLWSRSTDTVVRVFGGVLPLVSGLLLVTAAVTAGLGDLWAGMMSTGIAFSVLGCYLVARTFYDVFVEASR